MKKIMALLLAMAMLLTLVSFVPAVADGDVTVRTYMSGPSTNCPGWIETNSGKSFATAFSTTRAMKGIELRNYWAKTVNIKVVYTLYAFTGEFLSTVNDSSNILYTSSFTVNGDHGATYAISFDDSYPAGDYMVAFRAEKIAEDGHFVLPAMKYGVFDTAFPASYFENYKYDTAGPVQSYTVCEPLCYAVIFDGSDNSSDKFFKPLKGRDAFVKLDDTSLLVGMENTTSPAPFSDAAVLTPEIAAGKSLYSITFPGAPTYSDNSGNIGIQYDVYEWADDYDASVDADPIYTNVIKGRLDGKDLELFLGGACAPGGRYLIRLRGFHYDPDTGNQTSGQIVGAWFNINGGTAFNEQGYVFYYNGAEQPLWAPRFAVRFASLTTETSVAYKASELTWVANCGTFTAQGDSMVARNNGSFAMWCEAALPEKIVASDYNYFAVKCEFLTTGNIGFYAKFPEVANHCFGADKYSIPAGEQNLFTTFNAADAFKYENYYGTVVLPLFGAADSLDAVRFDEIAFFKDKDDLLEYLGQGICSAGLTLGEDITFNVSANVYDTSVSEVSMIFTTDVETVTVDGTPGADGKYHFAYEGLTPQRMADEILMELVLDGVVCDSRTSSVDLYAQDYYDLFGPDDPAIPLLAHLLQYGTAAQEYKNYNTGNPAAHENWSQAAYITGLQKPVGVKTRTGSTDPNNTISAASILLDNGFKLKFRYKAAAGTEFVLTDKDGDEVPFTVKTAGASLSATADVSLMPLTFRDAYTAKLVSGEDTIVTVNYSFTAYINAMWDDVTVGPLVQALYAYLCAAETYVGGTV